MNACTSTIDQDEQPALTLDTLLETMRELEMLLPELLFVAHKHVPRTKDGEPFFASLPEFDWPSGDVTGRRILYLHPDNLPLLHLKAKGMYRLVEWTP